MPRATITSAERIVIKIGSSSLTLPGGGIDLEHVTALVEVIANARKAGREVVLVSSGAIATGFPLLGLSAKPKDLATAQAAASVGQGELFSTYSRLFAERGITVGQILLTADDMNRRSHYRNAQQTMFRLLELGVLPIVNENDTVATAEIRLGDNDRLAALVAHLVNAKALVLLSDVEGLYDRAPSEEGARLISDVRGPEDLEQVRIGGVGSAGVGLGGMVTKVEAAQMATDAGIAVVLTSAGHTAAAVAGEPVGTFFHATGDRASSRLLWLAHAVTPLGSLTLDAGAVNAVVNRRLSLLPAGVTAVTGVFDAGDPVDVCDEKGHVVARGLVNYDSHDLPQLLGKDTRELAATLGPEYEREVMHRDDIVVLHR